MLINLQGECDNSNQVLTAQSLGDTDRGNLLRFY